jgi:steroid 5-alpha reductase family enzyme
MVLEILLGVLGAMLAVMLSAWAFGLAVKNGGWTDVFWSYGTGLVLAGAALWPLDGPGSAVRQIMLAIFLAAWGLRLGAYLHRRVAGHPEDPRYAAFRAGNPATYPLRMLWVSLPQAPASALLSISVVLIAALAGETMADEQMRRFRTNPANMGQVMDQGLWAWSRHPNYFFQWLGWTAYPVIALDPTQPLTWLSLVAAGVMYGLLRHVSGVPPLETAMLASRGDRFRDYQRRVSVFFPLPPKTPAKDPA